MSDFFSLKDKIIVISGASSGIGKSCAELCAEAGAKLILLGRDISRLENAFKDLNSKEKPLFFQLDITSEDEVNQLSKTLIEQGIKVSGLVHSAGLKHTLPLKNTGEKILAESFSVNVFSGFYLSRAFSQKKLKAESQSLVFISSIAGVVGEPANLAYSATKGALISGTKSLALELAKQKTRVNCISPAMVSTPLSEKMFANIGEEATQNILDKHPLGIGNPEDVAKSVIFLLSDGSSWITGTNLIVDGGYSAH
ncbi:SDR family NAD(P)-dependent oxidoreductase [Epilithonimonas zeae]|uniref:SDR family NAD(P)-dependent oxidoreductase n=1 Tax=Epilithonimonas zeae TaxID=1416779 RepID=UPI00200EDA7B|nr:SDR family oxidoreductase [Epilithonimonas zeae]UQB67777.1 SDR family oxidoreductase [Epilithonimonas zeae]